MSRRASASVSVIVCAYTEERWELLVRAIDSIEAGAAPLEVVLVVDNNPGLLARARERWPHHVVVPNEGPRGLSHARNTAIAHASGDVLAFLDDDAFGHEGWLDALVAPFAEPDIVAVGGVAVPLWPAGRPASIPPELDWIVGCSFAGQQREGVVRNVMGCNMAFRAAELRAIGGFETGLGRVGKLPLGCEETDACIRVTSAFPGTRIVFSADAVVSHTVTPERARARYVVARSYAEGISKAVIAGRLGGASLSTERDYLRRTLPRAAARELAGLRIVGATAIVASVAAAAAGYVRGSLTREYAIAAPAETAVPA